MLIGKKPFKRTSSVILSHFKKNTIFLFFWTFCVLCICVCISCLDLINTQFWVVYTK